jgi:hypothetical protein
MKPQAIDTKYALYILEDGIMHITWHHGIAINIDIAKEMVEERIQQCNGKTKLILVDINGLVSIDTTSRKFLASEHATIGVTAGALIVGSLISKLAGNVYITVDKPRLPMRLFTDKIKAIKWLQKQAH